MADRLWILVANEGRARLFSADGLAEQWTLIDDFHDEGEAVNEHGFAHEVTAELESGARAGEFDRLILVAPPALLSVLRQGLSADLRQRLLMDMDLDLSQLKREETADDVPGL